MRLIRWTIRGALVCAAAGAVGVALFGTDLGSYLFTGGRAMREAVSDSVPIEFELRRANDMIDELIPEMHANIRLVAQEEVEIEALEAELVAARQRCDDQRTKLTRLRDALRTEQASYTLAGQRFTRDQVKQEMNRRLDSCRNAEDLLAGKEKLLSNRRTALSAAVHHLGEMRQAKEELGAQVAAMESQFRLVQASAAGGAFELKVSKLSECRSLIKNVKRRLDVAQRVLEKEQHFVEYLPAEVVSDNDLIAQVDQYLDATPQRDAEMIAQSD
jgi:hypothetical protein